MTPTSGPPPRAASRIVCDEEAAYGQAAADAFSLFADFPREFYIDGRVAVLMPEAYSHYRSTLQVVVPDRFTIFESLDEWLDELAAQATQRRLVVTVGGSHTAWVTSWPLAMAERLEELAPGGCVVINVAVFGYTLLQCGELAQATATVLATRGLSIDWIISLDGYNDILFRLRGLYRYFVDRTTHTPSMAEADEDAFLSRNGWDGDAVPDLPESHLATEPLEIGDDYGQSPPALFRPLPEWQAEVVDRIVFALAVFRRAAAATGAEVLNVLQPVASLRYFAPHGDRLREAYRSECGAVCADFYAWRSANKRLLHGGEYLLLIASPPWRIDAVLDLDPCLNQLDLHWNRSALSAPWAYLNLLAQFRDHYCGDAEVFAPDACHYAACGAESIGNAVADFLASSRPLTTESSVKNA